MRRIVERIPIFGDSFASDAEILKEFENWEKEDEEEKQEELLRQLVHKRVKSKRGNSQEILF